MVSAEATTSSILHQAPPQLVIGTAGHVDHGKTSLVQALTGSNPDRLPEEKLRGMTIELGFAFLGGSTCDLAFIDCPGHERFIAQMVAGAGSIDGCLLIIAADEGPCAQTREHLDVLKIMGIRWGRVVITKTDLVSDEQCAVVCKAAQALVVGTPLAAHEPIAVSVRNGNGINELKLWLQQQSEKHRQVVDGEHVRLPIDRVFTVAGIGTVITGTLLSGKISLGDQLEIFPGGLARVRGLQINKVAVETAIAGQRTAVNLTHIDRQSVRRGAWLATAHSLQPTSVIDVRLDALPIVVRHRHIVEVYHGTACVRAHLHLLHADDINGGVHDAQLRMLSPLYLRPRDRLIIRRPSPAANIAGGIVVDTSPPRHRRFSPATTAHFAAALSSGCESLLAHLTNLWPMPGEKNALTAWAGGPGPATTMFEAAGDKLVIRHKGQRTWMWTTVGWQQIQEKFLQALAKQLRGDPEQCWWHGGKICATLWPSLPEDINDEIITAAIADGACVRVGNVISAPHHIPPFPKSLLAEARRLLSIYHAAQFTIPYDNPTCEASANSAYAERALTTLRERGLLIRINDRMHIHRHWAEQLITSLMKAVRDNATVLSNVPQWLKSQYGLSRKHTIPMCDWLDAHGITKRVGDNRILGTRHELDIPQLGENIT